MDLILRNTSGKEPFVVAWQFPQMTLREDLDPDDLKQVRGRKKSFEEADILEVFGEGKLTTSEWLKQCEAAGISSPTFYRLRRSLVKSGRIVKAEGDKWQSAPK